MAAGIFPTTLLLVPITYVLVVVGTIVANSGLTTRISLAGRCVAGPLLAAGVGVLVALVVAPATVARFALGYAVVGTAFFTGIAVRCCRWVALMSMGLLLLGTWFSSTNTAPEVVALVGAAAFPVSLLGYRSGRNPENESVRESSLSGRRNGFL